MKLTITKELLTELLAIERFIATIPTSEQYKAFLITQKKRAILSDLQALSLSLELSFSEKELKRIYTGQEINLHQHPTRAIRNCISAMKYIDSQKDIPFTLATIQHINKLLSDGYVEFWEEGKMREPKELPSVDNDSYRNRPSEFSLESFNQIKYINASDEIEHPLLKGILFLYYFLLSYPFAYFNLQTALLCFYGIVKPTYCNGKGMVPLVAVAYNTLSKVQLSSEHSDNDLSSFATQIGKSFINYTEMIQEAIEQREAIPEAILTGLNDRQLKALSLLKRKRKLSRRKYAIMNNVAIATAFRDLKDMVDKGLATTVGVGRGTYYMFGGIKKPELTDTHPHATMELNDDYDEVNSLDEL